jgi:hypothetical protein
MTTFIVENGYVDTAVQKGGVPGFSGCVDHLSVIRQLIKEATVEGKDLTVVWLDLANAYGTIPHKLIDTALDHYHLPEKAKQLIGSYYDGINLSCAVGAYSTAWQKLEKGIVTGCTISVILCVMTMNLITEAGKKESRGPATNTKIRQPATRGFMDDLTLTTSSIVDGDYQV